VNAPPDRYIDIAIATAGLSPCAKSKRGAVVFDPLSRGEGIGEWPMPIGVGYNGQPHIPGVPESPCDGSAECRRDCAKICEHAEARAIREACLSWKTKTLAVHKSLGIRPLQLYELVHVKVVGGHLVPGGPPSCWQCSREILSIGLAAVWLYLDEPSAPRWRRYTANEFHGETLHNAGLHPFGRTP
jgi:hypothetical protein